MVVLQEILSITLTASPWLLIGLLASGFIKALIPNALLQRWMSGNGIKAVSKASVIGAPLPLCSCGAIPAAITIYRKGAGRGPTVAFMIGTPGIGMDSILITYALLGPFMTVSRAVGAVVTAVNTGLLVALTKSDSNILLDTQSDCSGHCQSGTCSSDIGDFSDDKISSWQSRVIDSMRYVFGELLHDIGRWILIGLVVAGFLMAYVTPEHLAVYSSGIWPMLLMAVVGIPIYLCATAATPIGAGLLTAGVSPGAVLIFLLAGPITSMATLEVLRREMGNTALLCYLAGIVLTAIGMGLIIDQVVTFWSIDVSAQLGAAKEVLPQWLEWAALILLVFVSLPMVRKIILAGRFS
ncbi:MAG: permease [Desulfonatronovibrio sp. MSAO_Bac4]|nr:MAG: permease [Desulfonatronovibrio sp. MSAO_Bac4]